VLHLLQAQPESLRTFLEPMDIPEAGRRLHVTVQVNGGGGGGLVSGTGRGGGITYK
jgi:hypothetical protein